MSLLLGNAQMPVQDPIAQPKRPQFGRSPDPHEGRITSPWIDWLTRLGGQVTSSATRINSAQFVSEGASVPATDIGGGALTAGLYRVSTYARIVVPASVSSSLEVHLDFTDQGVTAQFDGGDRGQPITGNTIATVGTEHWLVRIDGASPLRLSTTYASVGTAMEYDLVAVVEAVQA